MKSNLIQLIIFVTLISANINLIAQTKDSIRTTSDLNVYDQAGVKIPPSYPGGQAAIDKYFRDHFEYTSEMNGIKGRIIAGFTVEKDGSITDIKILRGLGKGTEKEATRLLNKMPKWKPAVHKGEYVRVRLTTAIPIG